MSSAQTLSVNTSTNRIQPTDDNNEMADTKGADNDAYNDIPLEDRIAIRAPDTPQ
jgi:hypothetical protein